MTWPNETPLTLLLENHGTPDLPKYRIGAFLRRTRADGTTYLEPFPAQWLIRQLEFAEVEFVTPPSTRRGADAGELSLTHLTSSGRDFGGRKP